MQNYIINNKEGLIGDFLGTVPAILSLAEENSIELYINNSEAGEMADFYFKDHPNVAYMTGTFNGAIPEMFCLRAFQYAQKHNMHMTQAFADLLYKDLKLETPKKFLKGAVKAETVHGNVISDYIAIAPCSRSLGIHERLSMYEWARFIFNSDPQQNFIVLYHDRDEDGIIIIREALYKLDGFKKRDNVVYKKAESFYELRSIIRRSKYLISVVSGPSHIAFHTGTKNILLTQQYGWGVNPDAYKIFPTPTQKHNISDFTGVQLHLLINNEIKNGAFKP